MAFIGALAWSVRGTGTALMVRTASPSDSLNTATASTSAWDWLLRLLAAAAISSTSAAFRCVVWSICATASPICPMSWLCSLLAALISPMMSVTRRMAVTTSVIVAPALPTSCDPCSTRSTLSVISRLISLAASALRPARLRTSLATTAKPRPCSPARAASTAAFRARMLVWKAMPSITLMMSAILWLLSSMPFIVLTTSATTSPPWVATVEALRASWLAWRALSAFCFTVEPSCSIDAAVCCSALACSSVRPDRSWLPAAISVLAEATPCALLRTAVTVCARLCCMRCSVSSRWPISSWDCTVMCPLRSPLATRSATETACISGRVIERMMVIARNRARAMVTALATRSPRVKLRVADSARWPASAMTCAWSSACLRIAFWYSICAGRCLLSSKASASTHCSLANSSRN